MACLTQEPLQVSNWFINARVRLWKPMVEDMYMEEMKEFGKDKPGENSGNSDLNDGSPCKASTQPKSEQISTLTSKQNNPINPQPSSAPSNSIKYGIAQTQDDEPIAQPLVKKARSNNALRLNAMQHSLVSHMKPEDISNRELLMKFMEARSSGENGHTMIPSVGNHGGGFGGYPIEEIGRFDPQHFAPSFHGNGVSLTLGLQHCEGLTLSGTEPPYLSSEGIPVVTEADAFPGMSNNRQTPHPSTTYDSMEIQNRKRFAAQLLRDFVA